MKKILDLLEQKVQWIVFALGVVFLLYMAWTYLIMSPVVVTVNNKQLTPGEIDGEVLTIARQLEARMTGDRVPTDLQRPPQYVAEYKADMDYAGKRPEPNTNALAYLRYGRVQLPDSLPALPEPGTLPPPGVGETAPQPISTTLSGPVEELPTATAPRVTNLLTGLSNVNPNPPAQNVPANTEVVGVDKAWVTVRFELDLEPLAQQWREKKIPANAQTTSFLRVVLTRQELMPDGTWGKEVAIGPLKLHNVPPYPGDGNGAAQIDYVKWAIAHTPEILQPPFYPVLKGDAWYIPGEQAPVATNVVVDFRPEQYLNATPDELMRLTNDQRRAVAAYRAQQRQQQGGARGGRGIERPAAGGVGNGIDFAPRDTDRPTHYQPVDFIDEINPIDAAIDGIPIAPPTPARVSTVAGAGSGKFSHPAGEFDPRTWVSQHPREPVVGWAHDETATPGATYRYKVRYVLKNPVFGNRLAVKVAELVDKLAIESPDSAWSSTIDVADTVSFFVQGAPREASGTVPIEVFRWQGGDPHSKVFPVSVGDVIGMPSGDVDFTTGWTIVDFSKDPRPSASNEWIILLMDSKGNVRRRTMTGDLKDARYQDLKRQVSAAAAAAMAR